MAVDSMTRVNSGQYYTQLGGVDYSVVKEENRVETGRTSKGKIETIWKAYRGDKLFGQAPKYSEAKALVMEDARSPRDDSTSPFAGEQLHFEYDDGLGETPIGPPTPMELQTG